MDIRDDARNRQDQASLARAFSWALAAHKAQGRKVPPGEPQRIPYISHLMIVSGTVLENGGTVQQAIAGLLHDAIEDVTHVTRGIIERDFGDEIAEMVVDCSDTQVHPKPPWEERKRAYLALLTKKVAAGKPAVLVSACDKLHNLSSLVADVEAEGLGYLERFNSPPDKQHWYFSGLLRAYAGGADEVLPLRLKKQLAARVRDFSRLLGAGPWDLAEPPEVAALLSPLGEAG